MKQNLGIDENKLVNFTDSAKSKLIIISKSFAEEVIGEANRIDGGRLTDSKSEITESILNEATMYVRRIQRRKKKKLAALTVLNSLFSILVGGLFDLTKFNDAGYFLVFIILISLALLSNFLIIINDD